MEEGKVAIIVVCNVWKVCNVQARGYMVFIVANSPTVDDEVDLGR